MDTTIQKSYYCYLESFIKKHLDTLRNVRVFIFGAGIRGCNLVRLLKIYGVENVFFVDNNREKHGTVIEECCVLDFENADAYTGKSVFLCPIEKGESILQQLASTGRKENVDYYNLDFQFTDYADLIEEIKSPAEEYAWIFGCCILSSYILGEKMGQSLGEMLREKFSGVKCKVGSLPGFYSAIYYYMINALTGMNIPKFVLISMEISSLSPYAPIMMGTQNYEQHRLFIEKLKKISPKQEEILKYQQTVEERLERSKRERTETGEYSDDANRKVYKLKYLYKPREDDESLVYMEKILTQMNEMNVPVILVFPPIDYQRGEKLFGDGFKKQYMDTKERYMSFLKGYIYQEIDASFIATSECFVPPTNKPDINPFLNLKGQEKLWEHMKEYSIIQTLLKEYGGLDDNKA